MDRRGKTHPAQWAALLDFAETHPEILTKKFDTISARKKFNEFWAEVSNILNSMGYLQKSPEKWQKAVADWKSKVKAKAADLNRGLTQTGGGGPIAPLNENETRLLSIIGWTCVTGTSVPELGFETETVEAAIKDNSTIATPSTRQQPLESESVLLVSSLSSASPSALLEPLVTASNVPMGPSAENADQIRLSPPSLHVFKTKAEVEQNNQGSKRKLEVDISKASRKGKRKSNLRSPSVPSRLDEFHHETLSVLSDINTNLKRMADAQEKICSILEKMASQ